MKIEKRPEHRSEQSDNQSVESMRRKLKQPSLGNSIDWINDLKQVS